MNESAAVALARELIAKPSTTPNDAGCQDLIAERLERLGFHTEAHDFGQVRNLWARRGQAEPLLCFAGHTDVVPTGPLEQWSSDPFSAEIRDGLLYGRGAADMKSGLAAMVVACEQFLAGDPRLTGSLAFLITSDEEGPSIDGTRRVVEILQGRGEEITWCLVGEPSSSETVGDTIKIGRRGSLSGILTVKGVQGHVAYPQLADNPIHRLAPVLTELVATEWDRGNAYFPPTSFQASNLHAGTGAPNLIPAEARMRFNLRYSTEQTLEGLKQRIASRLDAHGLDYQLRWFLSGEPFLTGPGRLIDAVSAAVEAVTGRRPALSTGGGTSDGRFIAPTGAEVVELGVVNATIHKVDECVSVEHIGTLQRMYENVLARLLS